MPLNYTLFFKTASKKKRLKIHHWLDVLLPKCDMRTLCKRRICTSIVPTDNMSLFITCCTREKQF